MRPENDTDSQPRSFIEEARRRQIVAAAAEVLADEGFGRATLARIARVAGISKGVISYHFAGKNELMREVVVQLYTSGSEFMTPQIAAVPTTLGRLECYIASNLDFVYTNRRLVAAAIEVVLNLRDDTGTLAFTPDLSDQASVEPLVELLAAGQASGEFGEFDPRILAGLIRDSIDGAANRAARDPDLDVDAYRDHMTSLYLSAVRPISSGVELEEEVGK